MKILFLDDDAERHYIFASMCNPVHEFTAVFDVPQALEALESGQFDLALLDHDLGGQVYCASDEVSGHHVAKYIAEMPEDKRPSVVIVHSWNESGAKNMLATLGTAGVRSYWIMFGDSNYWDVVV